MEPAATTGVLRFAIIRADVQRLSRYIYFRQKPVHTVVRLVVMALVLVCGVWELVDNLRRLPPHADLMPTVTLLFGNPPLIFGLFLVLLVCAQWFGGIAPRGDERVVEVTSSGIDSTQAGQGQVRIAWDAFIDIVVDRHAVYAFMTPSYAVIVPERAFSGHDEMLAWYRAIRQQWEQREHAPPLPGAPAGARSVTFQSDRRMTERALVWASRFVPRRTRRQRLVMPVIGALTIVALNADSLTTPEGGIIVVACAIVAMLLLFSLSSRYGPRVIAAQIARTRGSSLPGTVSLTPEALVSHSPTMWAQCPWDLVSRIGSDRQMIYFLLPGGGVVFVPRSAFLDPADADVFLTTAEAYRTHEAPPTEPAIWPPRPSA